MTPYPFYQRMARILNSGQANSILLHGNVHDLFYCEGAPGNYLPLHALLATKLTAVTDGRPVAVCILYQQNRPLEFFRNTGAFKAAWVNWRLTLTDVPAPINDRPELDAKFEAAVREATLSPNVALEFLRQVATAWRHQTQRVRLIVIIDDAEFVIPAGDGDLSRLGEGDRRNIAILQDWLSDPEFLKSLDGVVLVAEGISQVHAKITRLPQLIPVEVPIPDLSDRTFLLAQNRTGDVLDEARQTAGLSLHALRQLVLENSYEFGDLPIPAGRIVAKVESFIRGQLGEDVVDFFRPTHTLEDVVGATALKDFLRTRFIPRIQKGGAISGATVAGPIGGGKTFIFSAVAGELGAPVLVLKGIRSQWYGQTDVIFERLRRVLEALERAIIFVDEADTQGFGVGKDVHETERRLAGKMQAMMSDPRLRRKILWLLMTARPELLSPDVRRPGRAGDLIIPVLDPDTEDRRAFARWLMEPFCKPDDDPDALGHILRLIQGFSPATFASIRDEAKDSGVTDAAGLLALVRDTIEGDIGQDRRRQTLQALLNTTRMSLLPPEFATWDRGQIEELKGTWRRELEHL